MKKNHDLKTARYFDKATLVSTLFHKKWILFYIDLFKKKKVFNALAKMFVPQFFKVKASTTLDK